MESRERLHRKGHLLGAIQYVQLCPVPIRNPYTFATDTADGRGLVAIGCAEGVWIGFRHDSRCELLSLRQSL